jgi:AP-1-like factor
VTRRVLYIFAQLEDKVAALEAKNDQATTENVNLRDLLTRLQDENMSLKQAAFTFSVPKTAVNHQPVASGSGQSTLNVFNQSTPSTVPAFPPAAPPSSFKVPVFPENMDWTTLTTFDPAVLSLLDESPPQTTATDSAMNMDFRYNPNGDPQKSQFTTIAANPMFMSYADFEYPDSSANDTNNMGSFNFDMWTNSPRPDATATTKDPGLDELFGGSYIGNQGPVDFNVLMMSPSSSPIAHHRSPGTATTGSSSSSSNSTSVQSDGLSPISSAGTSPAADDKEHSADCCPRTKEEAAKVFKAFGQSTFVTEPVSHKPGDELMGKMVLCHIGSSSLPATEPKEDNLEVLSAFRRVTADPNYKVHCCRSL